MPLWLSVLPALTVTGGGKMLQQRGSAISHRSAKAQPAGKSVSPGTVPAMVCRRVPFGAPSRGRARNRPWLLHFDGAIRRSFDQEKVFRAFDLDFGSLVHFASPEYNIKLEDIFAGKAGCGDIEDAYSRHHLSCALRDPRVSAR